MTVPESNGTSSVPECLSEIYTGSVCSNSLQSNQDRFHGNDSSSGQIFVSSIVDGEVSERLAIQLISNLNNVESNVTFECEDLFTEFICLYLFGLCANNETLLLPSTEQCVMVRDACIPELEDYVASAGLSINCTGKSMTNGS